MASTPQAVAGLQRRSGGRTSDPRTDSTPDSGFRSSDGDPAAAAAAVQTSFTHAGPTVNAGPVGADAGVGPAKAPSPPAPMRSAFTNAMAGGQVRVPAFCCISSIMAMTSTARQSAHLYGFLIRRRVTVPSTCPAAAPLM